MVKIAKLADRKATALISDMNQPLGRAVGNALEVREAIDTLQGAGPADFRQHCLKVGAHLLALGGAAADPEAAYPLMEAALAEGSAWARFRDLVKVQGGDVAYVDDPGRLPEADRVETVPAPRSGYLQAIHARIVGETAVLLGAGRAKKGDPIDHAVGVEVYHNVGDHVEQGEPLFSIHASHTPELTGFAHLSDLVDQARELLLEAHSWSDDPVEPLPLFYDVVG
jgi:pyrimidine-nucleoside phosphorylase